MIYETRNQELFKRFWEDERDNKPRWWSDMTRSKKVTWDEFQEFCNKMWRIYSVDDVALVYIEAEGKQACIHFSLLRGEGIDTKDLLKIRHELLKHFHLIFGWCARKNSGLRKILKLVGFTHDGVVMRQGESHGQVVEYLCYTYRRKIAFVNEKNSANIHVEDN